MKKLLIATACAAMINPLCASDAIAAPATGEVKRPFISNGGFHGLCDRLGWTWGYINGITPACFSDRYAQRNGWHYDAANRYWFK